MKKTIFTLALIVLLSAFTSCKKDKPENGNNTPEPEPGRTAVTFDITVDKHDLTGVDVTVKPSVSEAVYFCNVYELSSFKDITDSAEVIKAISGNIPDKSMLHSSEAKIHIAADLKPATDYIVLAAGYDTEMGFTGDHNFSAQFRTEDEEEPEPEAPFSFNVVETGYNSATIEVSPQNQTEPYFIDVLDAKQCDSMSDDELVERLLGLYGGAMASFFTYTGDVTVKSGTDFGELVPDTEYYVMALGYDASGNAASTALAKHKFSTEKAADPQDNSFSFNIGSITERGASVTVTPSEPSVLYIWDVITEAKYQEYGANAEGIKKYALDYIDSQISGTFPTREDVVTVIGVRGEKSYLYESLVPATGYYVWALCVDASGNALAEPALSEAFTTLEEVISKATAEIVFSKFYDGNEFYQKDPVKYANFKDMAYVPATVERSAEAVTWYTLYTSTDIMDTGIYPDSNMRSIILKQGTEGKSELTYAVPWDTEVYFMAMAKDAEGNYGPVFRHRLTVTRDDISPWEE